MCGIFAILNNEFTDSVIDAYFKKGYCRGPENSQTKRLKNKLFGFHHLAINGYNDVSSIQPLEYNDCILICNGEIYNWKELYVEIGEGFKNTNSDCEIIIHLYRKYGFSSMLQLLDGVYAFVLYDKILKCTYVARDMFGIRPLYIGKGHNSTIFSSEMKMVPENINIQKSPGQTIYNYIVHITTFAPGTYRQYNNSGTMIYNSSFAKVNMLRFNNYLTEYDYKRMIRKSLYSAVEKRVNNTERPIACLLSGGLDSSLISALVSKILRKKKKKVRTFSIGFKGSEDLIMAEKVAAYIDSDHTSIIMKEVEFLNAIEEVIYNIESYDTTTVRASVGNYLIGKYISENTDCKVIFNGDGSDELTGGYMYFHYAPDKYAFDGECRRLLNEIHNFDVLRSDKSIASNGLEARTPFLDRDFVNTYLNIPIELRYSKGKCGKFLLRSSMERSNILPEEVLWRRKEAFSDGVSGTRAWFEVIQDYVKIKIYPGINKNNKESFIKNEIRKFNIFKNKPETLEQLYYRSVFEKYYSTRGGVIPYFWMPKFIKAEDASARTLDVYQTILPVEGGC